MATSGAVTSYGEWVQYYQRSLPCQPPGDVGGIGTTSGSSASPLAESTLVTTTMTAASSVAVRGSPPPAGEGRVGKASRRRSRPSRKTPTTLLSTDTKNFRAMVQQYTGAPSGPLQGAGYLETAAAGTGGRGLDSLSFGFAQLQQQQQQAVFSFAAQQEFPQYHQRHGRPPSILGGGGDGDGDVFLQGYGFDGGSQRRGNMEMTDGYPPESIPSSSRLSSTGCRNSNKFAFD